MKKSVLIFSMLLLCQFTFPAQDSILNSLLKQRDDAFMLLKAHRDTITIRTWVNVVTLNGRMSSVIKADSLVIDHSMKLLSTEVPDDKSLGDTIIKLQSRIKYLKANPPKNTKFLTPLDYTILFAFSFILLILGITALILLRKVRAQKQLASDHEEKYISESKAREDYEKRLEDISYSLSEITTEREKTLEEIENINRALLREKQQKSFYSDQYEALSLELNNLKQAHEKTLKDIQEAEFRLSVSPASTTDLITENNLLNSEIIQLKDKLQQLITGQELLKNELAEAQKAKESLIQSSSNTIDYQKLTNNLEDLTQKFETVSSQVAKSTKEAETLRNAHTVNMSTIASLQQRLELSDKALELAKTENRDLKEETKNIMVLRREIEQLNQEVKRWKESNEENAVQLKQEIRLRKNIEKDIQKIVGRFDNPQT